MAFTNITKFFFTMWMIVGILSFVLYFLCKFDIVKYIPATTLKVVAGIFVLFVIIILYEMINIFIHFNEKPKPNLDYIIVLGALVTEHGPAASTYYRLEKALGYLYENQDTKCILSGGKGDDEPDTEAKIMSEYLLKKGIDKNRIILEDKSKSTYENLDFSKNYLDIENDTVGIVSNNFHIYRALLIAKKIGYKNVCGLPSYSLRINLLSNFLRESMALIIYQILNYI